MNTIGVLALQGDFLAHRRTLLAAGAGDVREVHHVHDLQGLAGLVIPGGESTTLLNLMQDEPWFEALRSFHRDGGRLLGTCAGAILLAREVRCPSQPSLGLLDAVIERNAYGRQAESFEAPVRFAPTGRTLEAVFIRAPRFRNLGPEVEVLARLGDEPVAVRQGRVTAATFHPELSGAEDVHRYFLEQVSAATEGRAEGARLSAARAD